MRRLLTCAMLAAALAGCAQRRVAPPPSADIDEDAYRERLATLAGPDFAGRRPGTAGEGRTVAYIVDQFRRLKLRSPYGDSYLQQVPLVEYTPQGPPVVTVSGGHGAPPLVAGSDLVAWTALERPDVGVQGAELVFAGYGLVAAEYGRDDYAGVDVRGKVVVVLSGDPGPLPGRARPARTHMPGYFARFDYKVAEAARHGAIGAFVIHDPRASGTAWDVLAADAAAVRLGPVAGASQPGPAIEGWLSAAAGRALIASAGRDLAAATAAATGAAFTAQPLGLRIDAQLHQSVRRLSSPNVVAVLPGAGHRDEYVVYVAHWDHLGERGSGDGATVLPGAVDNASGVAGLLQIAQSFARTRPPAGRSVVFVAATGGEAQQAGSAWYTEHPPFPLVDTVAAIDLDRLRIGGPTRDVTVFDMGQSELDTTLRSVATLQGRELHGDPDPLAGGFYGSDGISFAEHGVPTLQATGGDDDAALGPQWGRAQREEYFRLRYHRAADRYSPDWDLRGTAEDLRLCYRVGLALARGGRFPDWYPGSEFSTAR